MAKKRIVQPIAPEEESQEVPDEEPARVIDENDATESSGASDINQTELIREAVQAGHAKPAKGVAFIKKKHGIDINPKYYSIVRGKLDKAASKEEALEAEAPEPKAAPAQPAGRIERVPAPTSSIPVGLFEDLKQLRQMKDRYGDEFEKLVDAIG